MPARTWANRIHAETLWTSRTQHSYYGGARVGVGRPVEGGGARALGGSRGCGRGHAGRAAGRRGGLGVLAVALGGLRPLLLLGAGGELVAELARGAEAALVARNADL